MPGDFRDLVAWQESVALVGDVVQLLRQLRGPGSIDLGKQLLRAAESIPANIAEGYGRSIGKDFCRFLRIAVGSVAEVESHIVVASQTGRLDQSRAEPVILRARRVRALLVGLIKSVERRSRAPIA